MLKKFIVLKDNMLKNKKYYRAILFLLGNIIRVNFMRIIRISYRILIQIFVRKFQLIVCIYVRNVEKIQKKLILKIMNIPVVMIASRIIWILLFLIESNFMK